MSAARRPRRPPSQHGEIRLRDESLRSPPPAGGTGRYSRLFPGLPSFAVGSAADYAALGTLGSSGGPMDAGDEPWEYPTTLVADPDGSAAGWAFFGQFVDHDITFDATSSLGRQTDPGSVKNFRTPQLELDSVYGGGRAVSPYLYDPCSPGLGRFLIDADAPYDLPRNSAETALIADPRNDSNLIVAQLHLAFLRLHNACFDRHCAAGLGVDRAFAEAQRDVRWRYQWIVVNEFLPDLVDDSLVRAAQAGDQCCWAAETIPVEFAVGAFRYGHSVIQPGYVVNFEGRAGDAFGGPILDPDPEVDDLSGGERGPERYVDWELFFALEDGQPPQTSRPIDTKIATPLFTLPFAFPLPLDQVRSLPERTLLRHLTFELPSGERVARAIGARPLAADEFPEISALEADIETPLWFYILREAERTTGGRRLGPVGARIVTEVLIGLLQSDPTSYLRQDPGYRPAGLTDLLQSTTAASVVAP